MHHAKCLATPPPVLWANYSWARQLQSFLRSWLGFAVPWCAQNNEDFTRRTQEKKNRKVMFWNVLNKHEHETTIIKISWKSFAQQRRVVGPSKSKLINWWIMMITSRIAKLWISSASKYVSELSTSIYPSYLIMKIYHICPCLHKNSPKLSLLAQWWVWCKMESNLSHVQQKLKLPKTQPNRSNLAQFLSHSRAPTVFPLHEALFFQAVPDLGDGAVQ